MAGEAAGNFDSRVRAVRNGHPDREHQMETRARAVSGGGMSGGILTTAGKLLFTGDSGSLRRIRPRDGEALWHQRLTQGVSNGPSSWMLDGKQYLMVGAGDTALRADADAEELIS